MLTILESIQLSTEYLAKKGIESARTNAELLLADILACDRLKLYLSFDKPLSEPETVKYRELIQRRGKFEPLQYITGKVDFYGLQFIIKPNVLIPRPETEFLIEAVITKFDKEMHLKILDIGCGSGIIPVTLVKNFPNAEIKTIDINEEALECARENAAKHEVERNISFEILDILSDEADVKLGKYDLIVSNPPYVSDEEFPTLQKEIVDYEPKEAVTDFGDGLTFYRRIASLANDKLNNEGWLFFEMGQGQSGGVKQILENNCFSEVEIVKDLQRIDRIIGGKKK
jgi:release factor glutamine methyltransferase